MPHGANMPSVPDPGDSGFNPSRWAGHLINAGLRAARKVGFGLGLVNELRDEIPIASQAEIGAAASTVGAGVRAAVAARTGDPAAVLDLAAMPRVPLTFFSGEEGERIVSMSDVDFNNKTSGKRETWNVIVNCGEGLTFEELVDCIHAHFAETAFRNYPEVIDIETNLQINLYFLGRRF